MSAQELITEHLDLWTEAVTKKSTSGRGSNGKIELTGIKKLRELILELAVDGKLVQQHKSDKPASELIRAAVNEKTQALKDKKNRKTQIEALESFISESVVPEGWAFSTLSTIGYWAIGNGFPKAHQGETGLEVLFCKVSDMNLPENSREIHSTVNTVSEKTAYSLNLNIHPSGTVIFPKIGGAISTNKRRIIIKPTAIDNNCLGITPTCAVTTDYLYLLLTSIDMTQYQVGTSVPALSQGTLGKIAVKLPPIEEQHRIVQKVDELMALCDQLEQQTSDQLAAHETLVDTLLGTLTQSENATELADNWARLATHFDTLFTTEQSIDKLKKTILLLAVMGRLVEQDTGDEPAEKFLTCVDAEIDRRITQGIIKKHKAFDLVDESAPYELPKGWRWEKLGRFCLVGTGATPSRGRPDYYSPPDHPWVTSGETSKDFICDTKEYVSSLAVKETNISIYPAGTLIVAMYGQGKTRGQITELKVAAGTNQACAAVQPIIQDVSHRRYIKLCFVKLYDEIRENAAGGAQPNLNTGKIANTLIPLPPLAEQHRIVKKVDEMMALCDQLKKRLNQASETQCQLAEALVSQAIS